MKNRTVLGIVCIVLAILITFFISPYLNRLSEAKTGIFVLASDVSKGSELTDDDLKEIRIAKSAVPEDALTDRNEIIGKFAASDLYEGDYLYERKLSEEGMTADQVFSSLDGSQVAVSIAIDSFADGLSGKLENGDIISLIALNDLHEAVIPAELKYVEVITTTTSDGIDQDSVLKNEDGSYAIPTTVTVLVTPRQAKLLASYEDEYTLKAALVYRGSEEGAEEFLNAEKEYLKEHKEETNE